MTYILPSAHLFLGTGGRLCSCSCTIRTLRLREVTPWPNHTELGLEPFFVWIKTLCLSDSPRCLPSYREGRCPACHCCAPCAMGKPGHNLLRGPPSWAAGALHGAKSCQRREQGSSPPGAIRLLAGDTGTRAPAEEQACSLLSGC